MADDVKVWGVDDVARCMMAVRRMMRDVIATDLAMNPPIDMLLALYLAREEGVSMPLRRVCDATGAGVEVCRRWGLVLEERGLIRIEPDGYVLTSQGAATMNRVNEEIWNIAVKHLATGVTDDARTDHG